MYGWVPRRVPVLLSPISLANPKSPILNNLPSFTKIFYGFRSLWTYPYLWIASIPNINYLKIYRACFSLIFRFLTLIIPLIGTSYQIPNWKIVSDFGSLVFRWLLYLISRNFDAKNRFRNWKGGGWGFLFGG